MRRAFRISNSQMIACDVSFGPGINSLAAANRTPPFYVSPFSFAKLSWRALPVEAVGAVGYGDSPEEAVDSLRDALVGMP
jgi:hypothetical protein